MQQSINQSRADLPVNICIIMNRLGISCGGALEVRAFLSTESSENNLNSAAINVDVIVFRDTFEDNELHGVTGRVQQLVDMALVDAVALAEANCASHLLGHGESCRSCCGDDSGGVFRVGHAIGLGEFERSKVGQSFVGGESVLNLGETDAILQKIKDGHRRSDATDETNDSCDRRDEGRVGDSRDSRAGATRPSEVKRRCCEG
ncbi:hypothetical protein KCU83_g375, partial [Aureobasidium melanogenum]